MICPQKCKEFWASLIESNKGIELDKLVYILTSLCHHILHLILHYLRRLLLGYDLCEL